MLAYGVVVGIRGSGSGWRFMLVRKIRLSETLAGASPKCDWVAWPIDYEPMKKNRRTVFMESARMEVVA